MPRSAGDQTCRRIASDPRLLPQNHSYPQSFSPHQGSPYLMMVVGRQLWANSGTDKMPQQMPASKGKFGDGRRCRGCRFVDRYPRKPNLAQASSDLTGTYQLHPHSPRHVSLLTMVIAAAELHPANA